MSELKDDAKSSRMLVFSNPRKLVSYYFCNGTFAILSRLGWVGGFLLGVTHECTAMAQPWRVEMSVSRSNISNGTPCFRRHWARASPLSPAPTMRTRGFALSVAMLIMSDSQCFPKLVLKCFLLSIYMLKLFGRSWYDSMKCRADIDFGRDNEEVRRGAVITPRS